MYNNIKYVALCIFSLIGASFTPMHANTDSKVIGSITNIVGTSKSTTKYNGYDLYYWDGTTQTLEVRATSSMGTYVFTGIQNVYLGLYVGGKYVGDAYSSSYGNIYQSFNSSLINGYTKVYFYLSTAHPQCSAYIRETNPAYITKCPQFKVTVNANNNLYGSVKGSGNYTYNTSMVIGATPNECYQFVKWSDGNTSNPRTINVTKDSTFTAIFEKVNFTITLDADAEKGEVIEE